MYIHAHEKCSADYICDQSKLDVISESWSNADFITHYQFGNPQWTSKSTTNSI